MHRLTSVVNSLKNEKTTEKQKNSEITINSNDTLTIIDHRTNKKYLIKINDKVLSSNFFKTIKINDKDNGLQMYDSGYVNTASAKSKITYINGIKGELRYRGYLISDLIKNSNFLEVAFLLIYGELPSHDEYDYFVKKIMRHTYIHQDLSKMMHSFRYNAHPMGMIISSFAAMSTLHPEANPALAGPNVYSRKVIRNKQIYRIIGTIPTIAAFVYKHRQGRPYVYPSSRNMSYTENFLYMLDRLSNGLYRPNPKLAKALDKLFILHADHEMNCSTACMRHLTSSGVDVYTSIAGATAALYGTRHGGANQAVISMLEKIGSKDKIPEFIEKVKHKKVKLMGFGHRVYKNFDPRAILIRDISREVFDVIGKEPLIDIAIALEKYALRDTYFIQRKLYPNIDFYSGIIYKAMGFPSDFYPVLFAIPRVVGWIAHWNEFLDDPENKIVRPRSLYTGYKSREYVKMKDRKNNSDISIESGQSVESKRRFCSNELP